MASNSTPSGFDIDLQVYKVGGAVRDQLLDYPATEIDWVVIGATPADLLDRGFKQVGRDFPVFLHPDTGEEYALGRTERKSGHGYHGFELAADTGVTLEEDLQRRDLTINAMAMDRDGTVIDPYEGQADLNARILRHVSPAFIEDPLRVYRVARFAARYAHLGFTIAPETLALMAEIVQQGELVYLSPERIWSETERALSTRSPTVFFATLIHCGAAQASFPGVGDSALALLDRAAPLVSEPVPRWGTLMADLSRQQVDHIASALKVPNTYRDFGRHMALWRAEVDINSADSVLGALLAMQAIKQPELFEIFLGAVAALDGESSTDHDKAQFLRRAREAIAAVGAGEFVAQGLEGAALGLAIREARIKRLRELMATQTA